MSLAPCPWPLPPALLPPPPSTPPLPQGLDSAAAASVATELRRLRAAHGTALLLISHEPEVVALLMAPADGNRPDGDGGPDAVAVPPQPRPLANTVVTLELATRGDGGGGSGGARGEALFAGMSLRQRFWAKLCDYLFWSMPLVVLALAASGLAVALLSADLLRRIDVTEPVLTVIDREVRPLLALVGGGTAQPMLLQLVKTKVRAMLESGVPEAKAAIYAAGMAKLFVLEVGPLLTALLLCGRVGGSYAGEVATLQATHQVFARCGGGASQLCAECFCCFCVPSV